MLLDALFRSEPLENPSVPVTGEAAETDNIFARDVYVSPETSMKLAAVYACIYVISSSVAQMPLHVMRKTNEHVQPARDHPLFWLVHDEPNAWQTSYKWRELKQRHVLGWGNGYTWVKRNRRGEVTSLECCMPWETTLLNTGGRHTYGVYNEEGAFAVSPDDMIHISNKLFHRINRSSSGSSVDRKSFTPPPFTRKRLMAVKSATGPSILASGVDLFGKMLSFLSGFTVTLDIIQFMTG